MEKYEFLSRTGEGAYGSVWRARDKNTGLMVAVKKMKDVPTSEEEGEIAMREVRVLQLAKHVNVVNLLEAYKSQSGRLYLVFEYVERTLLQELKANRGGMPPAAVKSITWQLLQALGYLHRKQIIHRDVKPSNILLTDSGVVKVCDFGFARACSNTSTDPAYTTYVVTRWYRPPEVLVGDTYGPPVDIWALGCIFAEMLAGRPLFPGKNHHDQLWLILKCVGRMTERQLHLLDTDPQFACFRLPTQSELEPLDQRLAGVSPTAMQVLRACLDPDPKQRASADELLSMPYFEGVTESLPLEDLTAYPDPDLRARLDRAVAQDQAVAAAAAAAREAALSLRRPLPLSLTKPHVPPFTTTSESGDAASPRPALAQLQQQQSAAKQQPAGSTLPSKSATVSKLEPHVDLPRPPLQRHITAPPGTIAGKLSGAAPSLTPLVVEVYGNQQQQSQSQSQSGSEGSQHGSPRGQQQAGERGLASSFLTAQQPPAGALPPARGRPSWRLSGDGSCEVAAGGQQGGRQPALNVPSFASCGHNGHALEVVGRPGAEQAATTAAATSRPPYHRTTWNGSAAPKTHTTASGAAAAAAAYAAGTGLAINGITAAPGATSAAAAPPVAAPLGPSSLGTLAGYRPGMGLDAVTVHRKAHSLAGNEAIPPGPSAPMGIRGAVGGLTGLQGRSLAPTLGQGGAGSGSSSAPAVGGFHLPYTGASHGLPTTAVAHRLTPSPPPGGYGGGLRGTGAGAHQGLVPSGVTGRASHDGAGSGYNMSGPAVPHVTALPYSKAQLPYQHQHQAQAMQSQPVVTSAAAAAAAGALASEASAALLDLEVSDSCVADTGGFAHNDGRRASDTVLYAAVALREANYRIDKAAHIISVPARPQLSLGADGSSGPTVNGLGVLRAPSFNRNSCPHGAAKDGPPSPDLAAPGPANLPPLQGTPQRRLSASDSAGLHQAPGSSGCSSLGAANGVASRGVSAVLSQPGVSNTAFAQRPSHKFPLPREGPSQGSLKVTGGLQSTASVDPSDFPDCSSCSSAQAFLPTLDVGAYSGKGPRVASAAGGVGPALLQVTRRPSKGSLRALGPDSNCKREEASKGLLLEVVPEAGVL